jgi:hypothetical protein
MARKRTKRDYTDKIAYHTAKGNLDSIEYFKKRQAEVEAEQEPKVTRYYFEEEDFEYASGGEIEEVWNGWSAKQREHFLSDHKILSNKAEEKRVSLYRLDELPIDLLTVIKSKLKEHIDRGSYADGGEIEEELDLPPFELSAYDNTMDYNAKGYDPYVVLEKGITSIDKALKLSNKHLGKKYIITRIHNKNHDLVYEDEHNNSSTYAEGGEIFLGAKVIIVDFDPEWFEGYKKGQIVEVIGADDDGFYHVKSEDGTQWYGARAEDMKIIKQGSGQHERETQEMADKTTRDLEKLRGYAEGGEVKDFKIERRELKSGKYVYTISYKGFEPLKVTTSKIRDYFVVVLDPKDNRVGKLSNNGTYNSAMQSRNKWSQNRRITKEYGQVYLVEYKEESSTYAEGGGLKGKRNVILKKFISKSSNYSPSKNKVLEDWQVNDKYARLRLTVNMDEISERQKIDLKDWEKEVKGSEFLDDVHNEEYWDFDGILELSEKAIISLNEVLNVEFDNKDYYFTYDLTDEGYAKNTSYAKGGGVSIDWEIDVYINFEDTGWIETINVVAKDKKEAIKKAKELAIETVSMGNQDEQDATFRVDSIKSSTTNWKRHKDYAEGGGVNDVDFQEWKKATISNRAKILGRVSEMRQAEGGVKYYKGKGYDVSEIEEALNPFSAINENNTYAEGGGVKLFRPTQEQKYEMKMIPFNPNISTEAHEDFAHLGFDKTAYSPKLVNIGRWVDISNKKGLAYKLPYKIISLQKNRKKEIIYRGANQKDSFGTPINDKDIKRWLSEDEAFEMYNKNIDEVIDKSYNYSKGGSTYAEGGEVQVGDVYKNKLADFSDVEIEVLKITDRGYEVNKTYAKSYKGKKTDKRISKKDFITKLDFQWEYAPTYAKGGQTYAEGGEIDTVYVEGKYPDGTDFHENQDTSDVSYVVEDWKEDSRGLSLYKIFIRFEDGTEREITTEDLTTYAEGGEAYSAGLAGEELTKSHLKISDKEWDELTYDEKVSARRLAKQDEIRGRKSRLEMMRAEEESKYFTGYLSFLNY